MGVFTVCCLAVGSASADPDKDFDLRDLGKVQVAAKYLTGEAVALAQSI